MHSAIEESDGRLVLVKTVRDLDTAMERWNEETAGVVAGPSPSATPSFSSALITIEGMHCVQGRVDGRACVHRLVSPFTCVPVPQV